MNTVEIGMNKKTGITHAIVRRNDRHVVTMCDVKIELSQLESSDNLNIPITCKKCLKLLTEKRVNADNVILILDKATGDIKIFQQNQMGDLLAYLKDRANDKDIAEELAKHPSESRYVIFLGKPVGIVPEVETIVKIHGLSVTDKLPGEN